MKITALIEKNNDDSFTVFTPELDHFIVGSGQNVLDAKLDFENSFFEMKQSYLENNESLPKELSVEKICYKYDIASLFDYYSFINVSKFAEVVGINASLMRQYRMGQSISERQMQKIENSLHRLGKELSSVKLV